MIGGADLDTGRYRPSEPKIVCHYVNPSDFYPDHLPGIESLPQVAALCADNAADVDPVPDEFTPQEARDDRLFSNPAKIRNESDSKIIHVPSTARAIGETGSDDD